MRPKHHFSQSVYPWLYHERGSNGGNLDSQIGIYRDAENGSCEVCMMQENNWKERVIDEITVYSSKFLLITGLQ